MTQYPLLLTRQQASELLGIDPKSFDKYIRNHPDFQCFMVGKQERYLKSKLVKFIESH
ncbi:TPA: helix-turn-helix domain-containing protein, partial [Streptococcus suis 12814]|nr:helix-turn-helix domain-containing protein [Streptococcus suis 12814]